MVEAFEEERLDLDLEEEQRVRLHSVREGSQLRRERKMELENICHSLLDEDEPCQ